LSVAAGAEFAASKSFWTAALSVMRTDPRGEGPAAADALAASEAGAALADGLAELAGLAEAAGSALALEDVGASARYPTCS
jgi:hypothetical protein